jgi:hypothetical protein
VVDQIGEAVTVLPGDIVLWNDQDRIVVDVTTDEQPMAVLRKPDDVELLEPLCVYADRLTATGHLQHVDGWVEDSPGIWGRV